MASTASRSSPLGTVDTTLRILPGATNKPHAGAVRCAIHVVTSTLLWLIRTGHASNPRSQNVDVTVSRGILPRHQLSAARYPRDLFSSGFFGHGTRLPAMGDDDGYMARCIPQPPVHQGGMFRSAGATIAGTKPQRVTRNNRTSTGGPWEVGDVVRALPDIGSLHPAAGRRRRPADPVTRSSSMQFQPFPPASRPGQIPQVDGDVSELGSRLGPKAALT